MTSSTSPAPTDPEVREPAFRLSRRRLLALGAMVLPGVLAARLLPREGQEHVAALEVTGSTDVVADAAAYDATAHRWAFVIDTTTCIGCGRCVDACKLENHVPEEPTCNRTWVELHVIAEDGSVVVASPDGGIDGFPPDAPAVKAATATLGQSYFVPRMCMQCENPPCVSVCPVSATYRTDDGVILVDPEKCIGCGYCVVACPYGARYIVPSGGETPAGIAGVADKCTFCYHRITRGMLGVGIQDLSPDLAAEFHVPGAKGALVSQVGKDTPAARGGLRAGDVIVRYDGKDVADSNRLRNLVAATAPGTRVALGVIRNGRAESLHVTIGTMPAEAAPGPAEPSGEAADGLAALGIRVQPLTPDLAEQLDLQGEKGVLISGVEPGSPAAEANLQPGDLIVEVNRIPVAGVADLRQALDKAKDRLLLLINRQGASVFVMLRLK